MVCEKCESKLTKVATPSPWKSSSKTTESGGRKINENKALTANDRFNPILRKLAPCRLDFQINFKDIVIFFFFSRICRQKVHQAGSHYCQTCAYKKAICAMCGKKMLDTKNYKQSST